MKHRKKNINTFSLFAFQDVMASVIGVLFFIVLLLALNVTEQQPNSGSANTKDEQQLLVIKQQELEAELSQIDSDIMYMTEYTNAGLIGDDLLSEKLAKKKEYLNNSITNLKNKIIELNSLADEVRRINIELVNMAEKFAVKNNEQIELAELTAAKNSNLSYIIDKTVTKKPILVEVSDSLIRVAQAVELCTVIEFKNSSLGYSDFIQWAKEFSTEDFYFVIMKKPSGIDKAEAVENDIKLLGFGIGTDLVPDDYNLF